MLYVNYKFVYGVITLCKCNLRYVFAIHSFFASQKIYCPTNWMYFSSLFQVYRTCNHYIARVHSYRLQLACSPRYHVTANLAVNLRNKVKL